jgi:beta-N-acetylhexosaminidase
MWTPLPALVMASVLSAAPAAVEDTVEAWLRVLPPEALAAQQVIATARNVPDGPVPGGVLLFGPVLRDTAALGAWLGGVQGRARVPLLVAVDMEGGRVNRLRHLPGLGQMPSGAAFGRMRPDEVGAWGRRVGRAMAGLGLNCNLAPVLDLADSGWMAATGRSLGVDPDEVAARTRAFAEGLWAEGVIPIGKHFPGYGEAAGNSDYQRLVVQRPPAEFDRHVRPFARVGALLGGVMLANLGYSFYDGVPAVFSEPLVSLAHEQGWVTVTDDLAAPPLRKLVQGGTLREVARRASRAGNDLLLVSGGDGVLEEVAAALRAELATPEGRARVEASVRRILRLKARAGLLPALPPGAVPRAAGQLGMDRPCSLPAPR